ncbi:MAG: hypothetical protein M1497_06915 [Nitrospirae bacterium]|nr:hypothetical protein [Nitrospirota bacterium]
MKRDRAAYWEEHLREIYNALYVASRDDFAWFELLSQDWEVADFLISDTDKRAAIDKEPSIVRSAVRTDRD